LCKQHKKAYSHLEIIAKILGKTALEIAGVKDYNPARTQGKEAKRTCIEI
jgi:hypothetical protein